MQASGAASGLLRRYAPRNEGKRIVSHESIFPRFSDAEYARRYAAVRAEMDRRGLDAVVAAGDSVFRNSNHANVYWLTNWLDPYAAYVVVPLRAEPFLVISNPLYLHHARRASVIGDVIGVYTPGTTIGERLNDLGLAHGRIGLVGVRHVARASMPYEHQRDLVAAMPEATFESANEVMQAARLIKSAEEIAWFEQGAAFTDRAIDAILTHLRPGMPEFELSAHIQASFLKAGGALMFHFLGATPMRDPEIIFPWQYPSTRVVARGDVLMTEISAGYWGYCGQIQRVFTVGAAPTPEYQRLYELAAEAYHRILEALKPGATDRDVLAAARGIEVAGFQTLDALLHGWGITIEPPRTDLGVAMIKRELTPFTVEHGMLLVIQPHVVDPEARRGVQVGNLVVCEPTGARALQRTAMQFFRVDAAG
jgi:Xaa-Pro aminopeptidase